MKTKPIFLLIAMFINIIWVQAQNDSIGVYPIYNQNNEYFIIESNDTLWLDTLHITLKFHDTIDDADRIGFQQLYNLSFTGETVGGYRSYNLPTTSDYITLCDSIYNDGLVEEFIFGFYLELYGFTPDDPDFIDQWYLQKTDGPEAWELTFGKEEVIVAIIDDGLFMSHEDLCYNSDPYENIFHNPGEDQWNIYDDPTSGNGIDDDGNGKIDDWKGWNYANHKLNPSPHYEEDNSVIPEQDWAFHGTSIAGIISAKTNNGEYMAGIAGGNNESNISGVKILPIKIFDWKYNQLFQQWDLVCRSDKIADAIEYSVDMGADIINLAFRIGDGQLMNDVDAALEDAYLNHDVLIIAAAGNEGGNVITYPGKSDFTMAVAASNQDDEPLDFSNSGDEMEIAAPGDGIISLDDYGTINYLWGTSYSSAMVSATSALVKSVNSDLTNEDIREILQISAEKVGPYPYNDGRNVWFGYGRLNTYYAVCEALE